LFTLKFNLCQEEEIIIKMAVPDVVPVIKVAKDSVRQAVENPVMASKPEENLLVLKRNPEISPPTETQA
jgi:hypothetical protein